jgi:lipoyl(octanoyl) transferase
METPLVPFELSSYALVWQLQQRWFAEAMEARSKGQSPVSRLLLGEHLPVYTFGRHANKENLTADANWLRAKGAEIHQIERGGDITFHGPGQLVAYPMFDLEAAGMGVKRFIESIESAIIACIAQWGISGSVVSGRPGVWVGAGTEQERKIAAIGVYCSRHYAMHGLALNVNTDLEWFKHMIPCGIADRGVTSMETEIGRKLPFKEVADALTAAFEQYFPFTFVADTPIKPTT